MDRPINILNLEDNVDDFELVQAMLKLAKLSCRIDRVQTREDLEDALTRGGYDIILADYNLPGYDGISALTLAKELRPDVPFIFVSGAMGEEVAIECLTQGATDYVLKQKISNLSNAVQRALREAENRRQRKQAEAEALRAKQDWERTFDAVPDLIAILDKDFHIVRANAALLNVLGKELSQCIGFHCYEVMHGTAAPPAFCPNLKLIEGELVQTAEIWEECLGGDFEVSVSPLFDGEHTLIGSVHTMRNISQRKRAEEKLHHSMLQLQSTVKATINSLSTVIEMRDPYTAGHQERVAQIASTIAAEMGLPEDQLEGIHIAAAIHDIGKIGIPAEILSKPSTLNNIEYSLIQVHPQIGFEILGKIEFPWPIAKIVYQHHERINGSGYPKGLRGDDILLEAKILGVADVIEAMSSHRPYRPALGMEKAYEEISKNKGILYDPGIVDICQRLIEKNGIA